MHRRIVIYIFCLILAILICGSIIAGPRIITAGGFFAKLGMVIYNGCRGLCHQDPERTYLWDGIPFPVCHRCLGIYAGALIGMVVYPFTPYFRRGTFPSLTVFLVFALPVGIDVFSEMIGLWEGYSYVRTVTGFMIALVASFYIVPGVGEMLRILFGEKPPSNPPVNGGR